ncbi:hypothetical protein SHIRM173S_08757 [Streptomyces hirsutus]
MLMNARPAAATSPDIRAMATDQNSGSVPNTKTMDTTISRICTVGDDESTKIAAVTAVEAARIPMSATSLPKRRCTRGTRRTPTVAPIPALPDTRPMRNEP